MEENEIKMGEKKEKDNKRQQNKTENRWLEQEFRADYCLWGKVKIK